MVIRTPERAEFLSGLLVTAIEHFGYGFPGVLEYDGIPDNPADAYAVIYDRYDDDQEAMETPSVTYRVTIDTMAKGLGIVRKMASRPEGIAAWVKDLILSDRTNGDDGDFDVLGALLVLECAIFGEPTYS
jgi:hypothetical protein